MHKKLLTFLLHIRKSIKRIVCNYSVASGHLYIYIYIYICTVDLFATAVHCSQATNLGKCGTKRELITPGRSRLRFKAVLSLGGSLDS